MQKSYYPPPPVSHGQRSVAYDLPPVQSVIPMSQPPPPPTSTATTTTSALLSAPPSRPGGSMKMPHLLQPLSHPPLSSSTVAPLSSSPYSHSYESSSVSPTEPAAVLPDAPPPPSSNGSVSGSTQFLYQFGNATAVAQRQNSSQNLHPQQLPQQKRAYRQRRKDPSCDACRERKVKCDASESTSCTECINRKVRCQFTKETNRRMSSIKQVQDLEKQLLSTKQQLQQFRSGMAKSDGFMDTEMDSIAQNSVSSVKLSDDGGVQRPLRRTRAANAHDLSDVRSNLRTYGRGIMEIPVPYRQQNSTPLMTSETPGLPSKTLADRLVTQYFACTHPFMPLVHEPSFVAEYERIYQSGSLLGVSRDWAACLFAMFACASLHTRDPNSVEDGREYLRVCDALLDIFKDDVSIDKVRAALLASIFLHEVGSKSASWVWMGSAVRLGQEIGLHVESGLCSTAEMEIKRRVWWGLYCWDRILSLEVGKPVMITDDDCDVDLPCPLDEECCMSDGSNDILEGQQQHPTSILLAMVHVVRSVGQLIKTLQSPVICPTTLETFERHFTACLTTLPIQYHPKSDQYLEPRSLPPIICLQNARFSLHRHNLTPACSHDARRSAMDYCLSTALDTTRLLSRCMQDPPPGSFGHAYTATGTNDWRTLLDMSASTMLCTHVFRCVLLLLFRQEYTAALVCIQACAIIGNSRGTNVATGRYIAFFLRCLLDRLRRNDSFGNLETDEEIIAYMSGDMQGTTSGNWVWQGVNPDSSSYNNSNSNNNNNNNSAETGSYSNSYSESPSPNHLTTPKQSSLSWSNAGSSEPEPEPEWEGWDWIERTVQVLLGEKQQQQQQPPPPPPPHPSLPLSSYAGYNDRTEDVNHEQYPSKPDSSLLAPTMAENTTAAVAAAASTANNREDTSPQRSNSAQSRMMIASII